jgi:hypothetical protein
MKTQKYPFAALALLAAVQAQAVHLSADGHGQVLLFPYYNAQKDNQTLLSVVNTTRLGKALKVRFLEGRNSRVVMQLNLYLAPEDVWTAAVLPKGQLGNNAILNSAIPAALASYDTSCTSPRLATPPNAPLIFQDFSLSAFSGVNNDGGSQSADRTREGHIEVIEMGVIRDDSNLSLLIVPGFTGAPPGCAEVERVTTSGNVFANEVDAPSGGIYGGAAILDLNEGSYINYDATALEGFRDQALHTAPNSDLPNLASAQPSQSTYFANGKVITSTWGTEAVGTTRTEGQRIDAVSSVLMANRLDGEWNVETALDAASEWVVSFPTKKFYTDLDLNSTAVPPFQRVFSSIFENCHNDYRSRATNRSGLRDTAVIGLPPPPARDFCFSTTVLSFNQFQAPQPQGNPTRILRSALGGRAYLFLLGERNGRYQLEFNQRQRPSLENHVNHGLPAIGFWALQILNRNVGTVEAPRNYGGAYGLKRFNKCALGGETNSPICQ